MSMYVRMNVCMCACICECVCVRVWARVCVCMCAGACVRAYVCMCAGACVVSTFLKVYMELGSYFLFLQEQIKDIIITASHSAHFTNDSVVHC